MNQINFCNNCKNFDICMDRLESNLIGCEKGIPEKRKPIAVPLRNTEPGRFRGYKDLPLLVINGRRYVDEEYFLDCLNRLMCQERKYAESEDEKLGIDICRNLVANLKLDKE